MHQSRLCALLIDCNVSDAANATVTSIARHIKDLFNLPPPAP